MEGMKSPRTQAAAGVLLCVSGTSCTPTPSPTPFPPQIPNPPSSPRAATAARRIVWAHYKIAPRSESMETLAASALMVAHYSVPLPPHAAGDDISSSSSEDDGSDFMEVDDEAVARPAALPQDQIPARSNRLRSAAAPAAEKPFVGRTRQPPKKLPRPPRTTKEHALDRQANKSRRLDKSSSSRLATNTSPIDAIEPLRRKTPPPPPKPAVLNEEVSGTRLSASLRRSTRAKKVAPTPSDPPKPAASRLVKIEPAPAVEPTRTGAKRKRAVAPVVGEIMGIGLGGAQPAPVPVAFGVGCTQKGHAAVVAAVRTEGSDCFESTARTMTAASQVLVAPVVRPIALPQGRMTTRHMSRRAMETPIEGDELREGVKAVPEAKITMDTVTREKILIIKSEEMAAREMAGGSENSGSRAGKRARKAF
ncbi:hypothetical protein HDU67_006943 [Dinochytrium kinnereticum]|nr:hypothetical protein HDU67_006943 [Dinochytrium kinnereticum]